VPKGSVKGQSALGLQRLTKKCSWRLGGSPGGLYHRVLPSAESSGGERARPRESHLRYQSVRANRIGGGIAAVGGAGARRVVAGNNARLSE
jgi:hypothetical protein